MCPMHGRYSAIFVAQVGSTDDSCSLNDMAHVVWVQKSSDPRVSMQELRKCLTRHFECRSERRGVNKKSQSPKTKEKTDNIFQKCASSNRIYINVARSDAVRDQFLKSVAQSDAETSCPYKSQQPCCALSISKVARSDVRYRLVILNVAQSDGRFDYIRVYYSIYNTYNIL